MFKLLLAAIIAILPVYSSNILADQNDNSGHSFFFRYFDKTKIMVITDMHYFRPDLISDKILNYEKLSLLTRSDSVMQSIISQFLKQKPDVVLVAGDMTEDGRKTHHAEVAKYLGLLKQAGIKVFVTPGNHDINNDQMHYRYKNPAVLSSEITYKKDFEAIYSDFGYKDAFLRSNYSLSYFAKCSDKLWILSIDGITTYQSKNYRIEGIFETKELEWIKAGLEEARKNEAQVIVMVHHPLLKRMQEHELFYQHYHLKKTSELIDLLQEYGVKLVVTGHGHAQDISSNTKALNTIFDIETGALGFFPHYYRELSINKFGAEIKSHQLKFCKKKSPQEEIFNKTSVNRLVTMYRARILYQMTAYNITADEKNYATDVIISNIFRHQQGNEVFSKADSANVIKINTLVPKIANSIYSIASANTQPNDQNIFIEFSTGRSKKIKNKDRIYKFYFNPVEKLVANK